MKNTTYALLGKAVVKAVGLGTTVTAALAANRVAEHNKRLSKEKAAEEQAKEAAEEEAVEKEKKKVILMGDINTNVTSLSGEEFQIVTKASCSKVTVFHEGESVMYRYLSDSDRKNLAALAARHQEIEEEIRTNYSRLGDLVMQPDGTAIAVNTYLNKNGYCIVEAYLAEGDIPLYRRQVSLNTLAEVSEFHKRTVNFVRKMNHSLLFSGTVVTTTGEKWQLEMRYNSEKKIWEATVSRGPKKNPEVTTVGNFINCDTIEEADKKFCEIFEALKYTEGLSFETLKDTVLTLW